MGYERLSMEDVDHYQEYLGPLEEQNRYQADSTPEHESVPKRGIGPSSTVICNHTSFMEVWNLVCTPLSPSFTPKVDLEKIPFLSGICVGTQSMFIERGGSKEVLDKIV